MDRPWFAAFLKCLFLLRSAFDVRKKTDFSERQELSRPIYPAAFNNTEGEAEQEKEGFCDSSGKCKK